MPPSLSACDPHPQPPTLHSFPHPCSSPSLPLHFYHAGHSATAGAAAGVLAAYFKKDTLTFTIGTECSGLAPRTYASLTEVRLLRHAVWNGGC
jgi:hypothetical protein